MPYYVNPVNEGLISANASDDGYTIFLKWTRAYPKNQTYKVAYHIYMAVDEDKVFSEGIKFVSITNNIQVDIFDLTPGQLYHFAVRAVEYDSTLINASQLPDIFTDLKVYPTSLLREDISSTSLLIPLLDASDFPSSGIIKIGIELVNYSSKNNNDLILTSLLQRGYLNTTATQHDVDGFDGYIVRDPTISFLLGREELNTRVFSCQCRFEYPQYQFTIPDGYHQVTKDILTSDLTASDAFNVDFPAFDFAGWRRTDPTLLLSGECVGSYIGGEQFCHDGYFGVGQVLRGMSVQDRNNQRLETLLELTGKPVVLLKRMWTGITCSCYLPSSEYGDDRCPKCLGAFKFSLGYEQYFNPRRSDGRIMISFSPTDDDLKMYESGLESEYLTDCWTLTVPTIKDRDILINFDQDDNEEFRYEVISVNRNRTLFRLQGAQRFRIQRIRKTDPAYRINAFRNTATLPVKANTGIGFTTGIPPHTHTITVNENSPANASQLTSVVNGHNHQVVFRNGQLVVLENLGHTHSIIL